MFAAAECKNLNSLSGFLGFAPQHIFYLVENPDRFYAQISVPKKSDPARNRILDIPSSELKGVQRAIHKKILSRVDLSGDVHSYVSGKSILTAAKEFCPGRAVLKLDIRDFFPPITFSRVFGIYKKLEFNDECAFILSRLATRGGCLTQGAPTSPLLSNILMRSFDLRMSSLAKSWQIKYLRYSDDIFFHKDKNFNHGRLAEISYELIRKSGFEANSDKTRFYAKGIPRITLGLLTHGEAPRIPGPQRRAYRALFFKASRDIHWAEQKKEHLRGILEWYKCVNGKDDQYAQYRSILDNISRLRLHDIYRSK
jgi:RNA-directed DNA polymerase